MKESFLDSYVDELYSRQNVGLSQEQMGLFTKKQYYELLRSVSDIYYKNPDLSISEMRQQLLEKSGVLESLKDFVNKKEMVPGLVVSYGTPNYKETLVIGNRQEVSTDNFGNLVPSCEKMTEDTIFDLASITKIFTSFCILILAQKGEINLNDEIVKYCPQFKNLKGVTIFDLLSFRVPLKTNGRIDKATSFSQAIDLLNDIEIDQNFDKNKNPYTDMGAMVLKYVIEEVSNMSFYDFVEENILVPLNMTDTHVMIPNYKLNRVASTNFDGKYYKDGNFTISSEPRKGAVFDPKARILYQESGNLSGHAGLFSSAHDMTSLAKGVIDGKVLNDDYLQELVKNRTGRKIDGQDKFVQYLGFLCYSKNPHLPDSELYHAMSGRSFASAGWTGTQLTVDPLNQLYFFMAGNRSHNRMTYIDPIQRDKVMVDSNGKKTIVLPNGMEMIDSTRFAWDRDSAVVHPVLKLAIQYKMLEDICEMYNEKIEEKESVKYL